MIFLLGESVEFRLVAFLQGEGHDVTAIAHDHPASLTDREVLTLAHTKGRILITNDRDFGELIFNQQLPHSGVIYFRLPLDTTAMDKMNWLRQLIAHHVTDLTAFVVITPQGMRVRRSSTP